MGEANVSGKKSETLKKWDTIINITPHTAGFIAYMHYLNIGFHKQYWMVYSALMTHRQNFDQKDKLGLFYVFFSHSM